MTFPCIITHSELSKDGLIPTCPVTLTSITQINNPYNHLVVSSSLNNLVTLTPNMIKPKNADMIQPVPTDMVQSAETQPEQLYPTDMI